MSDEIIFAQRRARVLEQLGPHAALVVSASPEVVVGADAELKYVVDPDLYYLTGYTEPEAVAVLCPSLDEKYTLFVRPRDNDREQWTGVRGGVEAATERFGADAGYPSNELASRLPALLAGIDAVYARLSYGRPDVDAAVIDTVRRGHRNASRKG
ncbi:MAG: aminopeptidase P N-terminal domain-containing protein, partial [Gemmatimonadetes bacterium]|nr:aminopeptidase P N-terminal domain-containing protein [Gemmatimonadota bacterium]